MEFNTQKITTRKLRLLYLGFAFLIAILYDRLFWDQLTGLALPLFTLVYLAIFLLVGMLTKQLKQKWAFLLLLPILILSFNTVIYTNNLASYALGKVVFLLTLIFSLLVTLDNPNRYKFSFAHIPVLRHVDLPFVKWGRMYKDLFKWEGPNHKDLPSKILVGAVISLPLLVIFTLLFVNADAIFSQKLDEVLNFEDLHTTSWRIIRTVAYTVFIASFFYATILHDHILGYKEKIVRSLDGIIVSVILVLINAMFLTFVFIQIKYLFGSARFILENGISFAEYARQGFFELAWVVGLAALMLIVVYRGFSYHQRVLPVTILQVLLVGQVGVIAYSALQRMYLYQAQFGFTVLRLYVEWTIYFVLLMLAVTTISLLFRISFRKFLYSNFILGVVAFTLVASVNVDKIIATENVSRFVEEGKEVDLDYLSELSLDAYPAVVSLLNTENIDKLSVDQLTRLSEYINDKNVLIGERESWREFNLSAWKTLKHSMDITAASKIKLQAALNLNNDYIQARNVFMNYQAESCYSDTYKRYRVGYNSKQCLFTSIDSLDNNNNTVGQILRMLFFTQIDNGHSGDFTTATSTAKIIVGEPEDRITTTERVTVNTISELDFDTITYWDKVFLLSPQYKSKILPADRDYHFAELRYKNREYYLGYVAKLPNGEFELKKVKKSKLIEHYEQELFKRYQK